MPANKITKKIVKKNTGKLDNSLVVANYYSFKELKIKELEDKHQDRAKKIRNIDDYKHQHLPAIEEYASILTHAQKQEEPVLPLLYYTKGEIKNGKKKKRPNKNIGLHIIGTEKSIAEAILIKTAFAILQEDGYKNLIVEINSLGDRPAQVNYNKVLTNFFRSKLDELSTQSKHLLKFGGHTLLSTSPKEIKKFSDEIPDSLEQLSEKSRVHFKEVIEYLESQNIPFEINKTVVGDANYSVETVFKIIDGKSGKTLAQGTRYNDLSRRTISRIGHPAVSLNIDVLLKKNVPASQKPDFLKCDIYFIQLGYAAKLKSLEVIEILRKSKIPVHHAIGRDKMSTQTEFANKKHVKYILLIGQKEAKENSICVRDLESNSQLTIPLDKLVDHLTKLRKKNKKK